jgi:hypothetical protein
VPATVTLRPRRVTDNGNALGVRLPLRAAVTSPLKDKISDEHHRGDNQKQRTHGPRQVTVGRETINQGYESDSGSNQGCGTHGRHQATLSEFR